MDSQRPGPYQPVSLVSVETTITGNSQKKRKSGGLFSSLKFWKRKDKKNTRSLPPISRPTAFQHLSGTSNRLVGATVEERQQKAISLPQGVTRHSALGSHAPFDIAAVEKQIESDVEHEAPRKVLQRRATLPKLASAQDQYFNIDKRQSILDNGQVIDPADIGFAVTSGANFLKRRSRSADALYALAQASGRLSPAPKRHERRRSDEIRYWRASVCPSPIKDAHPEVSTHDYAEEPINPIGADIVHEADSIPCHVETIHEDPAISEKDFDNRGTFDFGGFANTIHEQEQISIEERVITMEVKLMDLEYAVAKLQMPQVEATGMADSSPRSLLTTPAHESTSASQRSHMNSDAATSNSTSTQPTNSSLLSSDDPFTPAKAGNGNTISLNTISTNANQRNSLNGLTIDHLNSLIGLIRREQAARHRLEDQIVELQREFKALRHHVMPSVVGSPYARQRGWSNGQRSVPFDDAETDDGFQDVYETPTELNRRVEFEGGLFAGQREGAAF